MREYFTEHRAARFAAAVAGGQPAAFVAVLHNAGADGERPMPALGLAVANTTGCRPVPVYFFAAPDLDAAEETADRLNRDALGLDAETAFQIIASTMGGRPYRAPAGFAAARKAAADAFDAEFLNGGRG